MQCHQNSANKDKSDKILSSVIKMKWVKDKDEWKSLLRAFFQQEIFVVTQSLSRKDVNCDIQRLINKILRLWTLDWFLLTGSKPWSYSMKNCTLYFSTNNLLNMTSTSHSSCAIRMFWNILCYCPRRVFGPRGPKTRGGTLGLPA